MGFHKNDECTKSMHELAHEFTSRKISPWGGIKFFHGTYVRSGIREILQKSPHPSPGSNRGYNPVDLIEGFLCSVVLGSKRLAHTGMLRTDEVVKEIFGWSKGMADQSMFSRFFKKHSVELNDKIFPGSGERIASSILEAKEWYSSDDVIKGTQYTEMQYQGTKWKSTRRLIVTRIKKKEDQTIQGVLFEGFEEFTKYGSS